MVLEEFQEADVLWPDYDDDDGDDDRQRKEEGGDDDVRPTREDHPDVRKEPCPKDPCVVGAAAGRRKAPSTKPVRVPPPAHLSLSCVSYLLRGVGADARDDYIVSNGAGGGGIVSTPPHIVISRRMGERAAFSMCSGGRGRTLKGRDLRRVRNAVLRMTGFLES